MRGFELSRRALLRGLGVSVALPALDVMLDRRGLLHGTAHAVPFPRCLMVFFIPNGVPVSRWVPTTEGAGYAMPACLKPLEPFRDDINVISGLNLGITTGAGDAHG